MRTVRLVLSVGTVLVLLGGYLASQYAALSGDQSAAEYAAKVDVAPIRLLASFLVVAAIVLAFIPERERPT